jgi:VWFA-related protein
MAIRTLTLMRGATGAAGRASGRRAAGSWRGVAAALVWTLHAAPVLAQQEPAAPRFQSAVEVNSIDVTVVDDRGRPILDLKPADFTVRVDNGARRVVTAEWMPLMTEVGPQLPPPPDGYSTNESRSGGRLILIVIDQPNIRFGATQSILRTVSEFIDHLQPADRIAAVGLGPGTASTPFTADRERVKTAVARMSGTSRHVGFADFDLAQSEAQLIRRGDPVAMDRVLTRECAGQSPLEADQCRGLLLSQAQGMALEAQANSEMTIASLRTLLRGLTAIDAPKTIIFVSEGFPVEDQRSAVLELGTLAEAARASLYTLHLDNRLFDIAEPRLPVAPMADRQMLVEGLEVLAGAARGAMFNITGNAAAAFQQIESELSGYYLLGIESGPDDKNGSAHPLRVDVGRRGAVVRSRRILKGDAAGAPGRSPREAMAAALATPLLVAALPLRAAAFSLLGPETGKIQLLLHADIGTGYTAARPVALGYYITDLDGRLVDSQTSDVRLPPVMNGVPSPLQYVAGASVPPGDYIFKLAVAEGDRVGTIEHRFRAGVSEAGAIRLSDLMVGGPVDSRDLLRPTVGHLVSFGSVHGYVEAYGSSPDTLTARFEVAANASSAALVDREVAAVKVSGTRAIFSDVLLTRQLPPGTYVLRAIVSSSASATSTTLTRTFEVAAPPVLMTSAGGLGLSAVPATDVFLPVGDEHFARPFSRDEALRPDTLRPFRERVASSARTTFDQGIVALSEGDYERAEQALKGAVQVEADSTPILAYLAACFAATGHDADAAGAWQTALIEGSEFPEIYQWLGDALLRSREISQARTILEEAQSKWPSDVRFAKPLALTYAAFGQGREAVRALEKHLAVHGDDTAALLLAVEWIYHLRLSGVVAHSKAEDLKLAKSYANAYLKSETKKSATKQQAALVKQWLGFLESGR